MPGAGVGMPMSQVRGSPHEIAMKNVATCIHVSFHQFNLLLEIVLQV